MSTILGWTVPSLLLSGAVLAATGLPAQQSQRDAVRVTAFPKGIFRLTSGRLSNQVNLGSQLPGCTSGLYDGSDPGSRPSGGAATTRVIDLVRKGTAWYLTFQTTLNSGCNVQGLCGAGTSSALIWLKLTPALRVAAKQLEVIEDCPSNLTLASFTGMPASDPEPQAIPRLELRRGILEAVSVLPGDKLGETRQTVRYRHAFAEQGLSVSIVQGASVTAPK
ncbi:hypothetical protein [Deinococcus sp.]|uniref:hypothetical protein n=1 Tax=Deinococcus sp. TaxID=47478 RepID=UPI003CC6CAF8